MLALLGRSTVAEQRRKAIARYAAEARHDPSVDRIEVSVDGPWVDSRDSFWLGELADRSHAVVIGGEHYRIRPDLPERDRDCAGFAGRLHRIRFYSDPRKIIETRNLWHQGTIPPAFRDRLPDDAEFVREQDAVNG